MARMKEEKIAEIQRLYPQIYLACHVDHVRANSNAWRLSSRDSSILAHLDTRHGKSPRALAAHLGVVASTLSAAIARLARLGYITSTPVPGDRRHRELLLTETGAQARSSTSVLDSQRIEQLLQQLSPQEQREAIHGLSLLARAARQMKEGYSNENRPD
jgi:DNA-binding MarR family transcriptional regulator